VCVCVYIYIYIYIYKFGAYLKHIFKENLGDGLSQCFSTAGPRPGIGPWQQLYRAARGSPGICHFNFLRNFHE